MSTVIQKIPEDEKREEEDDCSWDFSDEDDDATLFRPFFGQTRYGTPIEALEHDKRVTEGSLDVLALVQQLDLSSYDVIKLINYLRSLEANVHMGQRFCQELKSEGKQHKIWQGETYLIPTDPEDAFLSVDFHELLKNQMCDKEDGGETSANEQSQWIALQQENMKLKQELEWLKLNDEGREGVSSVLRSEAMGDLSQTETSPLRHVHTASDKAYFQSYSFESIHREMLSDNVRTEGYRRAIEDNCHLFQGKVIMDVGCGTGILSLMACRAGAKRVYAVDASPWAASMAERVVQENGFRDRIRVFHSKVEDIDIDIDKVDVIVSEWMGYALLFESMLNSVLYARDRWLRPCGLVFPDKARLLMAGASEGALDIAFWKDVYGFSMTSIADDVLQQSLSVPRIHSVSPEHILTEPCCIHELDLRRMAVEDSEFTSEFVLIPKSPSTSHAKISAIVLWFDIEFTNTSPIVKMDTSPDSPSTHWCHTVLALKHSLFGKLTGTLSFSQDVSLRDLMISLHCQDDSKLQQTMLYTMRVVS